MRNSCQIQNFRDDKNTAIKVNTTLCNILLKKLNQQIMAHKLAVYLVSEVLLAVETLGKCMFKVTEIQAKNLADTV